MNFFRNSSCSGALLSAELVPWDSDTFNLNVAIINQFELGTCDQTIESFFNDLIMWLNSNNIGLISCRLTSIELSKSFLLEKFGFNYIETVLHPYIRCLQNHKLNYEKNDLVAGKICEEDLDLVLEIASNSFGNERIHIDPRLNSDLADRRYKNWVETSFHNPNHDVYALKNQNLDIVSFFVCESSENNVYWHLNAISPKFVGKGYGLSSWLKMLHMHKNDGVHQVSTTIAALNFKVLNLYSKLNFRFSSPEMTFHWVR